MLSEIDEFKGAWRVLGTLAPERLNALRRAATIESIGSSTRIEGSHLTDREVELLLGRIETKEFASRRRSLDLVWAAVSGWGGENHCAPCVPVSAGLRTQDQGPEFDEADHCSH